MIHLRIVAPSALAERALVLLDASPTVCNVVHLRGAARKPAGDVILCDVARHEASVIVGDLRALGVPAAGSIAIEHVDTELSTAADQASAAAASLPFGDAVVWEAVESRTSEDATLSLNFVEFMMIATVIAAVGILLDSIPLIIGAMVVGPEFGPIAGFCVAAVERRLDMARRSFMALAVGFPIAIAVAFLWTLVFRWTGLAPVDIAHGHALARLISHPNFFSFFIAFVAGTAGVLSLTSTKSGALIGVLISVTTIPAAANVGVAAAYADWSQAGGAAGQLSVNLFALFLGGIARLAVHRRVWAIRWRRHQLAQAGIPVPRGFGGWRALLHGKDVPAAHIRPGG